jgi:hypothetical protein
MRAYMSVPRMRRVHNLHSSVEALPTENIEQASQKLQSQGPGALRAEITCLIEGSNLHLYEARRDRIVLHVIKVSLH